MVEDRHYLADPEGICLLPGAAGAIRRLNSARIPAILVTNQSGIGRGYFGEREYAAVHTRLVAQLAERGARLDAAYHCPDPPGAGSCRKPGTAMFQRAAREHGLATRGSFYVGDRLRDVIPAAELGGTALLVRSPASELEEAATLGWITVVDTLAEAVDRILATRATN